MREVSRKRIRIKTRAVDPAQLGPGFRGLVTPSTMFVRGPHALPIGTPAAVEVLLASGERALFGEGHVARHDPGGTLVELTWDAPSRALVEILSVAGSDTPRAAAVSAPAPSPAAASSAHTAHPTPSPSLSPPQASTPPTGRGLPALPPRLASGLHQVSGFGGATPSPVTNSGVFRAPIARPVSSLPPPQPASLPPALTAPEPVSEPPVTRNLGEMPSAFLPSTPVPRPATPVARPWEAPPRSSDLEWVKLPSDPLPRPTVPAQDDQVPEAAGAEWVSTDAIFDAPPETPVSDPYVPADPALVEAEAVDRPSDPLANLSIIDPIWRGVDSLPPEFRAPRPDASEPPISAPAEPASPAEPEEAPAEPPNALPVEAEPSRQSVDLAAWAEPTPLPKKGLLGWLKKTFGS